MGAVVLIASVTGVAYFLEDRYAKADDLKYNYQQDRVRDLKSNIRWYQDQMSWIMNRCGKQDPKDLPVHAFNSYESYRHQKEILDAQLKAELGRK